MSIIWDGTHSVHNQPYLLEWRLSVGNLFLWRIIKESEIKFGEEKGISSRLHIVDHFWVVGLLGIPKNSGLREPRAQNIFYPVHAYRVGGEIKFKIQSKQRDEAWTRTDIDIDR